MSMKRLVGEGAGGAKLGLEDVIRDAQQEFGVAGAAR
ncbi:MAG: hypothetical protein JWQ20_320 [Conexibacter sp.]|nr:hypothetical protein [Conexibacter sp.]